MGYCRGLTGNREDARDLAGEAVMIVFENLEKLRKKDSFKAYLFGVARQLRLHQYRRNKFRGVYDEKVADMLPDDHSPPDAGPDVEVLYSLLGKLPPKQRECVVLFELSGFSLEEIRQLQGGTLSGVKSRIKRGREQLRLWLQDPSVNIVGTHICVQPGVGTHICVQPGVGTHICVQPGQRKEGCK
jgi:RNA polymerase sigma-70 factor (ECF subfamily)